MKISRNLAVAMTYADFSGLTDTEIAQVKHFSENVPSFVVTNWNEESNDINGQCSITRLWDHCVEIEKISEEG
jgi:hypothetical protein